MLIWVNYFYLPIKNPKLHTYFINLSFKSHFDEIQAQQNINFSIPKKRIYDCGVAKMPI